MSTARSTKRKQLDSKIESTEKNRKEFMDSDHKVMDKYYELMDANLSYQKMKTSFEKLIIADPDFYDPYIQLAYLLQGKKDYNNAKKILYTAYQRALARITNNNGNFPRSLPWLWLENRHIIRVIDAWAQNLWEEKKESDALKIFRELLRSNPNDNIGARFSILAIRLGLNPDYEKMFAMKNMPGHLDAAKTHDWFEKESKKFPREFNWWRKAVRSQK